MEYNYHGASIECDSAEIITRKYVRSSIVNLDKIGRCIKYKCSRNSSAEIKKTLNPLEHKYKESSHLNLADLISCENLILFVSGVSQITFDLINESGQHKASTTTTKTFTYAEIEKIFPNQGELKDPRQIAAVKKTKEIGDKV